MISMYIKLKDIFNSIDSRYFEGYYIAKIKISRVNFGVEISKVSYKKIDKRNIIFLKTYEMFANSEIYEIHITYFKPAIGKERASDKMDSEELGYDSKSIDVAKVSDIIFLKEDMNWFFENCNDRNTIHYGENPVVPAVIILKKIDKYLNKIIETNNSVSIKFYETIKLLDNLELNYTKDISLELTSKEQLIRKNKIFIYGVK